MWKRTLTKYLVATSVLLFCAANILLLLSRSPGQVGEQSERIGSPGPTVAPLQSHQTERVNRVADSVVPMEFRELVDDLSQHNHRYELAQMAAMASPTAGMAPHYLRQVLGDRRTAKIIELLREMPVQQRQEEAIALLRNKLATHVRLCDESDDPAETFWLIDANSHALHVALFVIAVVCDTDEFLASSDEWLNHPAVFSPDSLFLLSLYIEQLESHQDMSSEDLQRRLAALGAETELQFPKITTFSIYSASARTTDLDFTHRHLGVPADNELIIDTVIGFDDWPNLPDMCKQEAHVVSAEAMRTWFD